MTNRANTANNANNAIYPGAGGSGGVDFAPSSEYIGMALEELYSWVNNSAFYNTAPARLKPFYRKVQNWERWINGIVPEFHDFSKGVIPTHFAKAIVDKVSALIFGGGIMLQNVGEIDDIEGKNETLSFISDWARENALAASVQNLIRDAVGLGTGALKLNSDGKSDLWVEAASLSNSRYDLDARGKVVRASFFIQRFEMDSTKNGDAYGLHEERYYDEKNVPYAVYKVYRLNKPCNQGESMTEVYLTWEELPKWVRRQLKESYAYIRLDAPIRLPLTSLGVYLYRYTNRVSSMPHLKYGDSVLDGIIKYLCEYDILSACIDTEMYVSRARVMAKKQVQNPQKANYNSGLDNFLLTYYETMGNDPQPLLFIQPEIRAEQFKSLRNTTIENICSAIGISTSSFASYLNDSSNRTAREVSAEESSTTLLVENKRTTLLNVINALLEDVRLYFGKPDSVQAEFSKAGQTNYTLLVDNSIKVRQAGGSSLEHFVRTINPTMDEAQVKKEVALIRKEEKERASAQANSMFGNMDFGTDINDNGAEDEI